MSSDNNLALNASVSTAWSSYLPEENSIYTGVLVLTAACAIISLIPSLRTAGSLAMRSITLVTAGGLCTKHLMSDKDYKEKTLEVGVKAIQITAITLGIIGVLIGSHHYVMVSIAVNILALGILVIHDAVKGHKAQALIHLGVIAIDTLIWVALATSSWQLIVAASAVSAALMLLVAIKTAKEGESNCIDVLCYATLILTSISSAITAAEIHGHSAEKAHFKVRNNSDEEMYFYGRRSIFVGSLKPGESAEFIVPVEDAGKSAIFGGPNSFLGDSAIRYTHSSTPPTSHGITLGGGIEADYYDYVPQIWPALPIQETPTLPIGGTTFVTKS